jgi:hypothetical protein
VVRLATILLLPEDTSRGSEKTLEHLVSKSLRLLDSACPTEQINFEPATEEAKEIANAPGWRDQTPKNAEKLRRVLAAIATRISQPGNYAIFHFDGDTTWSNRTGSKEREQFESKVLQKIKEILRTPPKKRTARREPNPPQEPQEIERNFARLLPMVPFYSIESWLYQNTLEALKICDSAKYKENERESARQKFEAWAKDRSSLDELEKPKDKVCLWSNHNQTLASQSFPTREVYDVGKSFKAFVDSLHTIVAYINEQIYIASKQEELRFWWSEKKFSEEKLPKVTTRQEMDRLLSLLDSERTEEEILQQLAETPDGFPPSSSLPSGLTRGLKRE